MNAKVRNSLLKLVIGMAVGGYGYDPSASHNDAVTEIVNDLALRGVSLDANTVRKWLREGSELFPREALDGSASERK